MTQLFLHDNVLRCKCDKARKLYDHNISWTSVSFAPNEITLSQSPVSCGNVSCIVCKLMERMKITEIGVNEC